MSMPADLTIHRLRVTIEGIQPPILRRLEVASRATLEDLHLVLQAAIGWEARHLYEFGCADMIARPSDGFVELDEQITPPDAITLQELAPTVGSRLRYLYDLGDGWSHEVVVEGISVDDEHPGYPRLLEARGNCPPEDCGGPEEYVEYLRSRGNLSEEDARWWADFDPVGFDTAGARIRLQTLGWAGIGSFADWDDESDITGGGDV